MPPKPRRFLALAQLFLLECLNPDRRGFPLYFRPSDLPQWFRENRFWGRIPTPVPPPRPWLNYDLVDWVERLRPRTVLEWGSGGSTLWFSKICERMVSVEDDAGWYEAVLASLPTGLGNQVELSLFNNEQDYLSGLDAFAASRPDLILIDGSWRVACLEASLSSLRAGSFVVIHDSNHPEIMRALGRLGEEFFRQDRFGPCFGVKNFRAWTLLRRRQSA